MLTIPGIMNLFGQADQFIQIHQADGSEWSRQQSFHRMAVMLGHAEQFSRIRLRSGLFIPDNEHTDPDPAVMNHQPAHFCGVLRICTVKLTGFIPAFDLLHCGRQHHFRQCIRIAGSDLSSLRKGENRKKHSQERQVFPVQGHCAGKKPVDVISCRYAVRNAR